MSKSLDIPKAFKIVCVGNSTVGKSSIVERFCVDSFDPEHGYTVSAMFIRKLLIEKDEVIYNLTLHVWETGGQERFFALVPMYLRDADAVLFVFDTTDKGASLDRLDDTWLSLVESYIFSPVRFYTVGTKIDLLTKLELEEAQQKIGMRELPEALSRIYYTSAKENRGIDELFTDIGKDLVSEDFLHRKADYEEVRREIREGKDGFYLCKKKPAKTFPLSKCCR